MQGLQALLGLNLFPLQAFQVVVPSHSASVSSPLCPVNAICRRGRRCRRGHGRCRGPGRFFPPIIARTAPLVVPCTRGLSRPDVLVLLLRLGLLYLLFRWQSKARRHFPLIPMLGLGQRRRHIRAAAIHLGQVQRHLILPRLLATALAMVSPHRRHREDVALEPKGRRDAFPFLRLRLLLQDVEIHVIVLGVQLTIRPAPLQTLLQLLQTRLEATPRIQGRAARASPFVRIATAPP
mmetsp:Transcript_11078/g.41379  ORF Transcript_11078/g.41379 Transcript_11078/m.41379 type:complete len:236 (+) Transcript_11078:257-964(+)